MTFIPMNGLTYDPHPQLNIENPNVYMSMGLTAENVAKKFNIRINYIAAILLLIILGIILLIINTLF